MTVCVPCGRLTAAVYHRRAGWQGDLLELWGNYGNRRLVYPWLCQVENKELTRLLSCTLGISDCGSKNRLEDTLANTEIQPCVGEKPGCLPAIKVFFPYKWLMSAF